MLPLPRRCPLTGGEIIVTRIYCPDADVTIEGRFAVEQPPFAQLAPDQLKFVEIFVRNEGKLNRMEDELGLSYPTIRSRLLEIIRALGYEPGKDETPPPPPPAARRRTARPSWPTWMPAAFRLKTPCSCCKEVTDMGTPQIIPVGRAPTILIKQVDGNLTLSGWDRPELQVTGSRHEEVNGDRPRPRRLRFAPTAIASCRPPCKHASISTAWTATQP